MATKQHAPDPSSREEAQNLTREAVKELRHGNEDEAQFVLDEARKLDKSAVDEVLRTEGKGKSGS
jgi:hypothetical protein